MTESEDRYVRLPWVLRAYAEWCIKNDWSRATSEDKFNAKKLAFAIKDFVNSAMKSMVTPSISRE